MKPHIGSKVNLLSSQYLTLGVLPISEELVAAPEATLGFHIAMSGDESVRVLYLLEAQVPSLF